MLFFAFLHDGLSFYVWKFNSAAPYIIVIDIVIGRKAVLSLVNYTVVQEKVRALFKKQVDSLLPCFKVEKISESID